MIGFYNYSVIVTYLGLAISVFGLTEAMSGHFTIAVLCLALAGACDTFDGKIARSMKNRSHEAELFGVQIDSLCDCFCFGVFPAFLAYSMGMKGVFGILVAVLYVLGAVIRLAFFNVLDEIKRNEPPTNERKTYRGLPVTSIAIIFPLLYVFKPYIMNGQLFITILTFVMLAIAFFFVLDFKLKKPSNQVVAVYIIFVTLIMIKILTDVFL